MAAERFITDLLIALHHLAAIGYTGSNRGWIRPGLRLHVHGNYCAYFRVTEAELVVLRVVHGARDVDAIVFEPDGA